ncbi:LOW QUALITY PROTEIN: hypothetical protein Bca101_067779 [Brassica carinata]
MRNVVRLRRVGQVFRAAGYDGSSESSSSSESESDSIFEDENVVNSTESSHETGSSKFEEAEVLEEIEEESDHLEGMNFSLGMEAIPQASSDSFDFQYGYGYEMCEAMEISSSDIIEPPPSEIIEISSDSTVAVNIIDISSRKTSPWIPMPAWSPTFSFGGSIDFSLESIGQIFDSYYEYHYSPMPMESSSANPEAGTEAIGVDMELYPSPSFPLPALLDQPHLQREDQIVETVAILETLVVELVGSKPGECVVSVCGVGRTRTLTRCTPKDSCVHEGNQEPEATVVKISREQFWYIHARRVCKTRVASGQASEESNRDSNGSVNARVYGVFGMVMSQGIKVIEEQKPEESEKRCQVEDQFEERTTEQIEEDTVWKTKASSSWIKSK